MENNQSLSFADKVKNVLGVLFSNRKTGYITVSLTVLIVAFLFLLVSFFLKSNDTNPLVTPQTPDIVSPSSKNATTTGKKPTKQATLSLIQLNPKEIIHVNDVIVFQLIGESNGQTIRGYDGVFRFDNAMVSYTSVKNLFPSFDYVHRIRGDWVMVTGAQPLSATTKLVLKKKPLIEYRFTAKKAGIAYFPLSFVYGRLSDSNLISENSDDLLTQVKGISIKILP